MSQLLDQPTFATVVANTPLVAIDLVVVNERHEVLLGQRLNRPAQGFWFVPGGRIYKDERLTAAFQRITEAELGQAFQLDQAQFIGPFEHHYSDSATAHDISTHYVVLGFKLILINKLNNLPKAQHDGYRWLPINELLSDAAVHQHVKWYFQDNSIMRHT
jgi:colanic acid biosynthesis protein WcaH